MARGGRILTPAESVDAVSVALSKGSSEGSSSRGERVIPAPLVEAKRQAESIVAAAHARATAEYEARLTELEERVKARLLEVEHLCKKREAECALRELEERNRTERCQQDDLLGLASVLAERLIGEQLRLSPESLVTVLATVLREISGTKSLVIWASETDAPLLSTLREELAERFHAKVAVSVDPDLSLGDLVIESEMGRTDARLKTRLSHLLDRITRSEAR